MTTVSELTALKIENAFLRLQQLQATAQTIVAERDRCIEEARAEVSAPVGHLYNTDTRQFQPPNGPRPLSAPIKRQRKRVA